MIAFICHPYHRGGVTRWMVDMAIAYADRGETVFFVTVDPIKPFYSAAGQEKITSMLAGITGIQVCKKQVSWEFEFGTAIYKSCIYHQLLTNNVPTGTPVILSDDNAVWDVSALSPNRYKFIGVLHADEKVYYDFANKYLESISIWVCVSLRIKARLKENDFFKKQQVYVIPCGIFLPDAPVNINNSEKLRLVFTGRIIEYQKRVSDIARICLLLYRKGVDFKLEMIGDGDSKKILEETFLTEGIIDKVTFHGWLSKSKVLPVLFNSDLLLLTSDFEGMPVALMEALSAGCGIICTRVSGVEDLESNYLAQKCIWLNEVGDIQQAVENILKATEIPVAQRVSAAREIAVSEFSIETCTSSYDQAIEECSLVISNEKKVVRDFKVIPYSYIRAFVRLVKLRLTAKNV